MEDSLEIEGCKKTPEINFNAKSGILRLKGKSIPENATRIYEPIVKWLQDYIECAAEETNLHIELEYFNTASSIWIARIVKVLSQIDDREKLLFIHLYFDIEDFEEMEEEDFKEAIIPATNAFPETKVSIGVKIYGLNSDGIILNEKMVLF
ncbi:MAG: DUF1987 domain-containing protein [Bacteroidetes bacterium]|nr:DUF1987 domain-containing protein [Bacteroidota bacterium]